MKSAAGIRRLADIDWDSWSAVDRATLLFIVRDDQVLLIRKKRGLGAGKVNGPGGRLDDGETWEQAAIREVREELCITPRGLTTHGELLFQFVDGYSIHVRVFRAADCDGEAAETAEAVPLWTPMAAIPYAEMWADDRLWLPLLLAGKRFAGRFIFDGDDMIEHQLEELRDADSGSSGKRIAFGSMPGGSPWSG